MTHQKIKTLTMGKTATDWDLDRLIDKHVIQCLVAHDGCREKAAYALGISRATLFRRLLTMKSNGLKVPEPWQGAR